jgi:hypothetical protein
VAYVRSCSPYASGLFLFISRRGHYRATVRDSPDSPGGLVLAGLAVRLVESQRHELAFALREPLHRRPRTRGDAALPFRRQFLPGVRAVVCRVALARRPERNDRPATRQHHPPASANSPIQLVRQKGIAEGNQVQQNQLAFSNTAFQRQMAPQQGLSGLFGVDSNLFGRTLGISSQLLSVRANASCPSGFL